MKILIAAQQFFPDSVGGSARVAFEQACELTKNGAQVIVIAPKLTEKAKEKEIVENITIYRYGEGRPHIFGQSYVDVTQSGDLITQIVEKEKPDVLFVHQPTIGYALSKYAHDVPMVYMFHACITKEVEFQGLTGKGGWKKLFKWAFLKWMEDIETKTIEHAKKILVLSQYSNRLASRNFPQVKKNIELISTGIDSKRFAPTADKLSMRSVLGIPEDKTVLLTVRRLVPRMGLENLIKAMNQLDDESKKIVRLYIVGEGVLSQQLESQVKKLRLESTIFLTGRVKEDDLHMFYQAADCFVLSTQAYEGLGIATLEALASGLPVLGTPIGATKEILGKVDKRLLLDSSKPIDIAKGIKWFLEEGQEIHLIREKARELIEKEYTWEHAGKQLYSIIHKIL